MITIRGATDYIRRAILSPDCKYIAAISSNKIQVLELRPGKGFEKVRE
ncbi:MAG TPA: hypothetical protein VF717_05205 [Pyrinomonadaceae bacterium]|jgi:hypothetical protein